MSSLLELHQLARKENSSCTTFLNDKCYLQFGQVSDQDGNVVAYTTDVIKQYIELLSNPKTMTDLELMRELRDKFEGCEVNSIGGDVSYSLSMYGNETFGLCGFVGHIGLCRFRFTAILDEYIHTTQYPNMPFKFDTRDKGNGHPKALRLDWINKVIKILEDEHIRKQSKVFRLVLGAGCNGRQYHR